AVSRGALGRRAATGRDSTRARDAPGDPPRRRADGQPRLAHGADDPRPAARAQRVRGGDGRDGHAQRLRRDLWGPDARAAGRADHARCAHAGGHAAGGDTGGPGLMRSGLSLALAYRHVRAGLGRMVLSVAAVALGVALVVAIRLMNGAVLASFLDTVDAAAGRAALTVTAGEGLTFPESVADQVAAVPGVALAVPLVTGVAFPDDGSGDLLTVYGVDLTHEADVRLYRGTAENGPVLDDPIVFLSQPDSILLGRAFAASRGLQPGQPLVLAAPRGLKRFTVRGLLDPQGLAQTLGGRLVVMDLYAAERAFTADGQINQIDVVVLDDADVDATRRGVATALPPGLTAEETAVRKEVVRRTIGGFQAMVTAFGLLAVVAGFVICYSRLGAIFEARTWEVGLLRAVGLRRVVVFRELLKESLLLGVSGTAAGIPLGVFIGRHALPFVAAATAINFRLPVPSAKASVDLGGLAAGVAVGLGAAT